MFSLGFRLYVLALRTLHHFVGYLIRPDEQNRVMTVNSSNQWFYLIKKQPLLSASLFGYFHPLVFWVVFAFSRQVHHNLTSHSWSAPTCPVFPPFHNCAASSTWFPALLPNSTTDRRLTFPASFVVRLRTSYQPSSQADDPCFTVSLFSRLARLTAAASPRFLLRTALCFLSTLFFTRLRISFASIVDLDKELDSLLESAFESVSCDVQVTSLCGLKVLFWTLNSSKSDTSLPLDSRFSSVTDSSRVLVPICSVSRSSVGQTSAGRDNAC